MIKESTDDELPSPSCDQDPFHRYHHSMSALLQLSVLRIPSFPEAWELPRLIFIGTSDALLYLCTAG